MSDASLLETFPNPKPERDYVIEHTFPEFTSVCPKTGQPDFATVVISYVAEEACLELKGLKLYLNGYRNEGVFYEKVTNLILDDLVAAARPRWMRVVTRWGPRGGFTSEIKAENGEAPAGVPGNAGL